MLFSRKPKKTLDWVVIESQENIDALAKLSHQKPCLIFKHSTRCMTSSIVLRQFEDNWTVDTDRVAIYLLDLIQFRALSNQIANDFSVYHQSPQAILIKNGEAVYDASHDSISADDIEGVI